RRVTNGEAPVNQLLLQLSIHRRKSRRSICKHHRFVVRAIQSVRKLIVLYVSSNSPVCSLSQFGFVGTDHLSYSKASNLVVQQIQNSVCVARPIVSRLGFVGRDTAAIADKNCFVILPGGFQAEIIVNTSVCKNYVGRVRFVLKTAVCSRIEIGGIQFQLGGRKKRRKS